MLYLHPWVRVSCAALTIVAVVLAKTIWAVAIIYAAVLLALGMCRVLRRHSQIVRYALVLLVFLLGFHGYVLPDVDPQRDAVEGYLHGGLLWLRLITVAGAIQWLMLPLVDHPIHLKAFLAKVRIGGPIGMLIIMVVTLIPEVQARLVRIVDARKAQGEAANGWRVWNQIKGVPTLLMPLVSSLLCSAMEWADFWKHRGVLERSQGGETEQAYGHWQGALTLVSVSAVCASVFLI